MRTNPVWAVVVTVLFSTGISCQCGQPPVDCRSTDCDGGTAGGQGGGAAGAGGSAGAGGGAGNGGGQGGGGLVLGVPTRLQLLMQGTLIANGCGQAQVRALDDAGQVNPASAVPVALDGGGRVNFYETFDCSGTPLTALTLAVGESSRTFHVTSRYFGPLSATASSPGLVPASASSVGTATVRLTKSHLVLQPGTCVPAGQVETVSAGARASAAVPTRFTLVTVLPFGGANRDAGCGNSQFDVFFDAGSESADFFASTTAAAGASGRLSLSPVVDPGLSVSFDALTLHSVCIDGGTCDVGDPCCVGTCQQGRCQ